MVGKREVIRKLCTIKLSHSRGALQNAPAFAAVIKDNLNWDTALPSRPNSQVAVTVFYREVHYFRAARYSNKTSEASCGTPDLTVLHTKALMCLLRDTSDQLVQSRQQKL